MHSALAGLGLNPNDPKAFRASLARMASDERQNSKEATLISQSSKELQNQTLEMIQKLSKDVYYEIEQIDGQLNRLKKRVDSLAAESSHATVNSNVNASGVLIGSAIEPSQRAALDQVRREMDHLQGSLQQARSGVHLSNE